MAKMSKYKAKTTKYSVRLEDAKVQFLKEMYGDIGITKLIEGLIDERLEGRFEQPKKLKSPIIRMGGKSRIANKIVEMFPEHQTFVDIFTGAAHMLLAKPKETSKIEVINDKFDDIPNLFRVIKERPLDLREEIIQMPHARSYYEELKRSSQENMSDIEKAARYVYITRYSYYGDGRAGYRTSIRNSIPKMLNKISDELMFISDRLKEVMIENRDWKYILEKYDSPMTLYYIDPPYLVDRSKKGVYELAFDEEDTKELINRLKNIKGKFMLSHYENEFYNKMLEGYPKYSIHTHKSSGKIENGQKPKVVENVYCNFNINTNDY
jgi:DNA adenine methylase